LTDYDRKSGGPLDTILAACQAGRAIIPIFGGGISVESGIPVGAQITEYLSRVKYLSDLECWPTREFLLAKGWPSRHELNAELNARHAGHWQAGPGAPGGGQQTLTEILAATRARLNLEALASEVERSHPTLAHACRSMGSAKHPQQLLGELNVLREPKDWMPILQHLTGKNDSLVDSFFDRLVRDRRPSTAHQLIALLSQRLAIRLIFTTNFDDLIEGALREEELRPVVYEIVKGAGFPDLTLVRRHLSVIKLHGEPSACARASISTIPSMNAVSRCSRATFLPTLPSWSSARPPSPASCRCSSCWRRGTPTIATTIP